MEQRMELLAPAGSYDTLKAVIAAGADAVYVGGARFGARAYAKNFTPEELSDAIDYTHLHGKKLHLTINTLLKNKEIENELYEYFLPYYEKGVDAVIVQDAGVFAFLKKYFPDVELHASTQMTIASESGAKFWKDQGASRVVLSRELSLKEIADIHQAVDVELETFVHGALCYCYSGQCLFSSMLGGRSGNRGRCAGPCRLAYELQEKTSAANYPLSPKDLCAIGLLPELKQAGVSSLKIEGRMKQTGYASGVVEIYRKYLDLLELSDEPYDLQPQDQKRLLDLGNRSGFTDGYLKNKTGKTMMSLNTPAHESVKQEEPVKTAQKRTLSAACYLTCGQPAKLVVTDLKSGQQTDVTLGEVQTASKAPLTRDKVLQVLGQTGTTEFCFDRIELSMDENCFLPNQILKSLRRQALDEMRELLLKDTRRTAVMWQPAGYRPKLRNQPTDPDNLVAAVDTAEQLDVVCRQKAVSAVLINLHQFEDAVLEEQCEAQLKLAKSQNKETYLRLPFVLRQSRLQMLRRHQAFFTALLSDGLLDGFYVKTYDALGFLEELKVNPAKIRLDASIYAFSNDSVRAFSDMGYDNLTLPMELNAKELTHHDNEQGEMIIYGYVPYMISALCLNKNLGSCDHTRKKLHLKDRYDKILTMKNYCSECYNILYNATPTVLFEDLTMICHTIRPQRLRLEFSLESGQQVQRIFDHLQHVLRKETDSFDMEITKGHLKRGVE